MDIDELKDNSFNDLDDNDSFNDDIDYSGFNSDEAPHEKHSDLFKRLTDFNPFLKKQVSEWLGLYWSEENGGGYVRDQNVEPSMNIQGARWCINLVRTYARDNNLITQMDKEYFKNIQTDMINTIWLNVGTRAEEFGIKKDGDIMSICMQLLHISTLTLRGAGGTDNYKKLFTQTTNRSETVNLNPNQNQQEKKLIKNDSFLKRTGDFFLGGK